MYQTWQHLRPSVRPSIRPSVRPFLAAGWRQKCRLKEQLGAMQFIDLGKAATKVALFCHQSEAKKIF